MRIVVLAGGLSTERDVSISSGIKVASALREKGNEVVLLDVFMGYEENFCDIDALFKHNYSFTDSLGVGTEIPDIKTVKENRLDKSSRFIGMNVIEICAEADITYLALHGGEGENGQIQATLDLFGIKYTGSGYLGSALAMNKALTKSVLIQNRVTTPAGRVYKSAQDAEDWSYYPCVVKPCSGGSSVGITKVNSADELDSAITLAASFTDRILAEHAITNLREINCSVLGDADECTASVCEEPFMHDEILSYEDKYMSGSKGGSKGMASLGRKIPADLPEEKSEEIRKLACDVFNAINASGVVRIDFMIDCDTNKVYANEINTIPGSLAFYLWEATGLKYTDMIDRLAEVAFRRQRERENLTFTIDTNILSGVSFGAKGAKGAKL